MSVSVYFSNQIIQIAVGKRGKKASLSNVYTTVAPEGSIINGIIMDFDALREHLRSYWRANNIPTKDVYLVLNSNKIVGRNLEVPNMNAKNTLKFIMREFSDMQREDEDNVLASTLIGQDRKSRKRRLYAELAPKEQLREFITIFMEMGIELKGIMSSEGSIISYASKHLTPYAKTFILQIVNGNLVSNVLFVDGFFRYYNSVRCFNVPGTQEYLDDLARSLNQLEQFMSAERITSQVEKIFIAGTSRDDISIYNQTVRDHGVESPCELVNTGLSSNPTLAHESQKALYAISGLYDQGSDSNFLKHFSVKREDAKTIDPMLKKSFIMIFTTLIVMLVAFGIVFSMRLSRDSEYEKLRDYNTSPSVTLQVEQYDNMTARRDAVLAKYNSINTVVETLKSYPVCSDEVINKIEETARGYATIEILSFNADEGKVSFSAKSASVNDIYKYIDKLLEEKIFRTVDHTGYTYDTSDNLYDIHVNCTLAERVGQPEEE